jgi:hypothetical protein
MMTEDQESEYLHDAYLEREARRARVCRCGGDMPGHCPGPAACPMCESSDDDEDDDEGDA